MKTSTRLILTLAIGALALQGCAETSATRPDTARAAPGAAAAPASSAAIPENDGKPIVRADTKDNFEAVAAAIQQQMQPGGRYSFVSKAGRQTVDTRFADMRALFDQYGSVDKMDSVAQARMLQDQNAINEVLARYDSNRRVCWQEVPVGTHFPITICRTLGQIQNQRENARQNMDQARKIIQQENQIIHSPANGSH